MAKAKEKANFTIKEWITKHVKKKKRVDNKTCQKAQLQACMQKEEFSFVETSTYANCEAQLVVCQEYQKDIKTCAAP